jgi:hypothetical protein
VQGLVQLQKASGFHEVCGPNAKKNFSAAPVLQLAIVNLFGRSQFSHVFMKAFCARVLASAALCYRSALRTYTTRLFQVL